MKWSSEMANEEIKQALRDSGLRFMAADADPEESGSIPACQIGTNQTEVCSGGCQYGCYTTGCYSVDCVLDHCVGSLCTQSRCTSVGGCWIWIATFV